MGFMDKVRAGTEQAAHEFEKALDKGKTKAGEMQIEMQMDRLARKLGYLVFDFYRGRNVDQAERQRVLDELSRLEDQLFKTRAEAAAKAEAEGQARAARQQPAGGQYGSGQSAGQPVQQPDSQSAGGQSAGAHSDDRPAGWDEQSPPTA